MLKPVINVTPLIDVLLVLLIIFMMVVPLKSNAFKARIPAGHRNLPAGVKNHPDADDPERPFRDRVERTVFIKAPRGARFGSVAKVVDAVKLAGAYPVSLQIDYL